MRPIIWITTHDRVVGRVYETPTYGKVFFLDGSVTIYEIESIRFISESGEEEIDRLEFIEILKEMVS